MMFQQKDCFEIIIINRATRRLPPCRRGAVLFLPEESSANANANVGEKELCGANRTIT